MNKFQRNGQALLVTVVCVLAVSFAIVLGIANPFFRNKMNALSYDSSSFAKVSAEAGIEDALYRLKNNMQISSSEEMVVNNIVAQTLITTVDNEKKITTNTQGGKGYKKYEVDVVADEGVSFSYALQSGNGGFTLSGGSVVNGNVYSNGNVIGTGNPVVRGAVTAANSQELEAYISNMLPLIPLNSILFGKSSGSQDIIQSFSVQEEKVLNSISIFIKRTRLSPGDITLRITTNVNGRPGKTLSSGTIQAHTIGTSFGLVSVSLPGYVRLDPNETYWIVLDTGYNSWRYYTIALNDSFQMGESKIGSFSNNVWTSINPSSDIYFNIYTGGIVSMLSGVVVQNGDAWAHSIYDSSVSSGKKLYCKVGYSNKGKTCDTSRPDPTPTDFPISEAQISGWKESFENAMSEDETYQGDLVIGWQGTTTKAIKTINGDLTVQGGSTAQFGPLEIIGDLTIRSGSTLKGGPFVVRGDVYLQNRGIVVNGGMFVEDDLYISSGSSISLDPAMGKESGIIVVDGNISLSGGGSFMGSGQSESFPIVISTSNCNNQNCSGKDAISITAGSGAVVLFAPHGSIRMSGGTAVKAITGYSINLLSGSSVNYDTGLIDITLSTSPAGTWTVRSWKEVE